MCPLNSIDSPLHHDCNSNVWHSNVDDRSLIYDLNSYDDKVDTLYYPDVLPATWTVLISMLFSAMQ